jgi:hypothetical protein
MQRSNFRVQRSTFEKPKKHKKNPHMPSDFRVSNPLSQVGVRKTAFEVPFWGHVSGNSM